MSFAARLDAIENRIDAACATAGRPRDEVTLVAVSKNHPAESILALYDLGIRNFGESRLQEAIPKIEMLPKDIVWHFIGKLQSNKAKRAAELFCVIHTLESESQLKEIQKQDRIVEGLIEVNIAEEPQKSGISVKMLDSFATSTLQCPQVHFQGLMAIGSAGKGEAAVREQFRNLRLLNQKVGGKWLSMGMSEDFEVAIQEGSTHVRIGTALFGARI